MAPGRSKECGVGRSLGQLYQQSDEAGGIRDVPGDKRSDMED